MLTVRAVLSFAVSSNSISLCYQLLCISRQTILLIFSFWYCSKYLEDIYVVLVSDSSVTLH